LVWNLTEVPKKVRVRKIKRQSLTEEAEKGTEGQIFDIKKGSVLVNESGGFK